MLMTVAVILILPISYGVNLSILSKVIPYTKAGFIVAFEILLSFLGLPLSLGLAVLFLDFLNRGNSDDVMFVTSLVLGQILILAGNSFFAFNRLSEK